MTFQINLQKYQSFYVPLAIFVGCLVIAAAIYGSGGIRIGGSSTSPETASQEETESPAVAGEEEAQTEYDQATLDRFAKCLTEKGVTLYTHKECGHCQNQKDLFGSAFQHLKNVECADESGGWSDVCLQAGISGVPTWVLRDGSQAVGVQTLEALSGKTGCPLQ